MSKSSSLGILFRCSLRRTGATAIVVAAVAAIGVVPASAAVTVPGAPSLKAVTAGPDTGQMTLRWTVPTSTRGPAITAYTAEWSANGGTTWSAPSTFPALTLTQATACGAPVGASCTMRVRAVNSAGTSAPSNVMSTAWAVPTVPQNFVANAGPLAGQSSLRWAVPANNGGLVVDRYDYDVSTDGVTWSHGPSPITTSPGTAEFCKGLTRCWYRLRAHNAAGFGAYTAAVSADLTVPGMVQFYKIAVGANSGGSGAAQLAVWWAEPDTGGSSVDFYELQLCASLAGCGPTNAYWNTAAVTNVGTTLAWAPTCPVANQTCAVRVRAHNAFGYGAWRHKFLTPYAPTTPSARSGSTSGSVDLSWTATTDFGTGFGGYRVFVCSTTCTNDANWTDTGLVPGLTTTATHRCGAYVSCSYRIGYVSAAGERSTLSGAVSVQGASEPTAPTNLTAMVGSISGSVDLTWDPPSAAGTAALSGYEVVRDSGAGPGVVASVHPGATSWTDTTCGTRVACTYTIAATNAVGSGAASNRASASGADVPDAPRELSATPGTKAGAVELEWTAPKNSGGRAVLRYAIERNVGDGFVPLTSIDGVLSDYTDVSCGAGTTCRYQVFAVNAVGAGAASEPAGASGATVSSAPTAVVAQPGSTAGAVDLSWQAPASNGGQSVTHYVVQRSVFGTFSTVATPAATTFTLTDAGCGASTSCTYRVAAVSVVGQGAWSASVSAVGADVPRPVATLSAATGSGEVGAVSLGWSASVVTDGHAVLSYVISRSTGGTWSVLTTVPDTQTTYFDASCGAGVSCSYGVVATNAIGAAGASPVASATGSVLPNVVTGLSATTGSSIGAVALRWSVPVPTSTNPATGFVVQRSVAGGAYGTIATPGIATTSLTDSTCGASVSCQYRVAAVNDVGTGPWSDPATATGADAPSAPVALAATSLTTLRTVDLVWTIPASTGGSAITDYQYRVAIAGGAWGAWTSTGGPNATSLSSACDATVNQGRSCAFQVRAVSALGAGAASATTTATALTDTQAPAPTLTAPTDGVATTSTQPTISGTASSGTGDATTVTVRLFTSAPGANCSGTTTQALNVAVTSGAWSATPAVLSSGTYYICVVQSDWVPNTGASAARTFTVDTVAPAGTMATPPTYVRNGQVLTMTSTTDANSGVASVRYEYCAGSTCTFAAGTVVAIGSTTGGSPWSVAWNSQPADGAYRLRAHVFDRAGNETISVIVATTVDNAAPTPSSITLNNGNAPNQVDQSDTVSIVFSEALSVSSLCSTWTNDTANQSISSGNAITVTITNSGSNDLLTVASNTCTLRFGSVALGADYVSTTTTFGTSSTNSRISWTVSSRTLLVTLGARSSGSVNSGVSRTTVVYTPNSGITDRAGNGVTGTATGSSQRF